MYIPNPELSIDLYEDTKAKSKTECNSSVNIKTVLGNSNCMSSLFKKKCLLFLMRSYYYVKDKIHSVICTIMQ